MKKIILILLMIIFITGCGKKDDNLADFSTFDLESNETKLVRQQGENYETYYYEDEKIVGYATYTVYETSEEADKEYSNLTLNQEIYKNISLVGNVIVIEYTEEYVNKEYGDLTVSKLKEKYNDFIQEGDN